MQFSLTTAKPMFSDFEDLDLGFDLGGVERNVTDRSLLLLKDPQPCWNRSTASHEPVYGAAQ